MWKGPEVLLSSKCRLRCSHIDPTLPEHPPKLVNYQVQTFAPQALGCLNCNRHRGLKIPTVFNRFCFMIFFNGNKKTLSKFTRYLTHSLLSHNDLKISPISYSWPPGASSVKSNLSLYDNLATPYRQVSLLVRVPVFFSHISQGVSSPFVILANQLWTPMKFCMLFLSQEGEQADRANKDALAWVGTRYPEWVPGLH